MNDCVYLDNAATTYPKPESVYTAMDRFFRELGANPGRSGHSMAVKVEEMIDNARLAVAKFFNISDFRRVVFTLNATDGLNMGIKGVLNPGDHVITSHLEHNSVSRPLERLSREGIIEYDRARNDAEGFIDPDDVKRLIRKNTRMIVITHVSNAFGTIQPVGEISKIARERGIIFFLDASQSAGVVPLDIGGSHIDMFACPGHKALFGPTGTGIFWAREGIAIRVWREGGTGGDSKSPVQPDELPYMLEGGTPNTIGIAGLKAGIEFLLMTGIDAVVAHEKRLLKRIFDALSAIPKVTIFGSRDLNRKTGVVSFNIAGLTPQEASGILDESFSVKVRSGLHCAPYSHKVFNTYPDGTIRASLSFLNTAEEVDLFTGAVNQIVHWTHTW